MGVPLAASSLSASRAELLRIELTIARGRAKVRFCRIAADLAALLTTTRAEDDSLDRGLAALDLYEAQERIEEIEDALLRIADGRYGACTSCSAQLTFERLKASPQARLCAACALATAPSVTPAKASSAPEVVRRLVVVATEMLGPANANPDQSVLRRRGPSEYSPLERVARLRDELHVTALRIARFTVDEHPVVDPVRIKAPTAASAILGAGQLLCQLRIAADRLVDLLVRVTPQEWLRVGAVGDRPMTLRDLVDDMLVDWTSDFFEPLETAPDDSGGGVVGCSLVATSA